MPPMTALTCQVSPYPWREVIQRLTPPIPSSRRGDNLIDPAWNKDTPAQSAEAKKEQAYNSGSGDIPGRPMAKTPRSQFRGPVQSPGQDIRSYMSQSKSWHRQVNIFQK